MTISGPFAGDPIGNVIPFGLNEIGEMRQQLVDHTDDPSTGICVLCGKHQCRPWKAARLLLGAAGVRV